MNSLPPNQNQTSRAWTERDYKAHDATYMAVVKGVALFAGHVG